MTAGVGGESPLPRPASCGAAAHPHDQDKAVQTGTPPASKADTTKVRLLRFSTMTLLAGLISTHLCLSNVECMVLMMIIMYVMPHSLTQLLLAHMIGCY